MNTEQLQNQVNKNTEAIKELQTQVQKNFDFSEELHKKTNQNMNRSQNALSTAEKNKDALQTAAQRHGALHKEMVELITKNQKYNNKLRDEFQNKMEASMSYLLLPFWKRIFTKKP